MRTIHHPSEPRAPHRWLDRERQLVLALVALTALVVIVTPAQGTSAAHSDSSVFTIPGPGSPPTLVGSSHLVRNGNGVSLSLETSGLTPGHAVTMWVVVANAPEECEAGLGPFSQCGPGDHVSGRGEISVHHGAGGIVGEDGTAGFGAHLRVGDTSRGLYTNEPGLLDPLGAEVIAVFKDHGPKIPGLVSDQMRTFAGGCQLNEHELDEIRELAQLDPPREPKQPVFGDEGPNQGCDVVQFSAHTS